MRKETYTCTPEEFLANAWLPVRVMETEADMMEEIAQLMFDAIERTIQPNATRRLTRLPLHINDPEFARAAAAAFLDIARQ
jgi:uncharacterized protein (UPF0261 family)